MKRVIIISMVVFFMVGMLSGCSATRIQHPEVNAPPQMNIETLNRSQYEVLEKTSGKSKSTLIGLWPLPFWWLSNDDGTFWMWGFSMHKNARHIARTRAIKNLPKADELIEPIREEKTFVTLWYNYVTTTVTGKGLSINSDKKCEEVGGRCYQCCPDAILKDK